MDGPPLLTPNIPRFAPPRGHSRIPSRSPTRSRLADDILSDLSPATTLEAFQSPSGRLKASIEAATPSERAFGIRATLASKKIQEWVDELSDWPWPADGGPTGFEMPTSKRRKLPNTASDHYEETRTNGDANLEYCGSLLATEVERYENRIDDIHADMDDLNVEEIKRQVLDTHFSPRSRPSSSASNAPMPSLFASYTKMDDFTAIVTATVLQSLPNLSRLMRLMDVWSIRLSVLRKVPPLLLALDDVEVALKSGWNTVRDQENDGNGEEAYLSRSTFEIMRDVLQDKVTTLGQDLDYMLDTLEGREDTLPDKWLDRMETIENDYGSWVVAGDRKVREGEWAQMAKARKEQEESEAEIARRKVEAEAEATRRKALQEAEDTARFKSQQEAEAELERKKAEEAARLKAIRDEEDAAKLRAQQEAEAELRRKEEEDAEAARRKTQREAEVFAILKGRQEEEAEVTRIQALEEARLKGIQDQKEATELTAKQEAEADAVRQVEAEAARLKAIRDKEHTANLKAQQEAEFELARRKAEEEARLQAEMDAERVAREETDKAKTIKNALDQKALADAENLRAGAAAAELPRQLAQAEAKRQVDQMAAEEKSRSETEALRLQQIAEAEYLKQESERLATHARVTQDALYQKAQEEAESDERLRVRQAAAINLVQQEAKIALQANEVLSRDERLDIEPELLGQLQSVGETRHNDPIKIVAAPLADPLHSSVEQTDLTEGTSRSLGFAVSFLQDKSDVKCPKDSDLNDQVAPPLTDPLFFKELDNTLPPTDGNDEIPPCHVETIDPKDALEHAGSEAAPENPDCPTCAQIERHRDPSPPRSDIMGSSSSTPNGKQKRRLLDSLISTDFENAVKPQVSRYAPYDGGNREEIEPLTLTPIKKIPSSIQVDYENARDDPHAESTLGSPIHLQDERPSTKSESLAKDFQASPKSPKLAPFGHPFANLLRRLSSPKLSAEESTQKHTHPGDRPDDLQVANRISDAPPMHSESRAPTHSRILIKSNPEQRNSSASDDSSWVVIRSSDDESERISSISNHSRAASTISGYPDSDPTPEIYEAEPAEYFQPVLTPVKSGRSNKSTSPVKESLPPSLGNVPPSIEGLLEQVGASPKSIKSSSGLAALETGDASCDACDEIERETEARASPVLPAKSKPHGNGGLTRILIPRRDSVSSEASTITTGGAGDGSLSPTASLLSKNSPDMYEQSPTAGRVGHRSQKSYDFSPPNSPPASALSKRPSLQLLGSHGYETSISAPSTPLDAPVFDNVDVSTVPLISSPRKVNSDDQLQQQISSLLESIPARIQLTSEPESLPFKSNTLRPKKSRRSINPSFRPSSSLSNYSTYSRAPTPSFTLAPAFSRTTQSSRPQSSNPEIKLYHLSRSTGEAPIKLFVRLVGENGERVMVRVGGGWADLGEYLKEYASHHGRRSAVENADKVEIQDLPPRTVSNSSSTSTATLRGNGRSSPMPPRPMSVLERDRPGSSLFVRKSRKSVGESEPSAIPSRINDHRSPSTPLPTINRRSYDTPPSATSINSSASGTSGRASRLSWTEEDSSLGLAGPKSKKVVISERDQEWVESMKEKVRLASAEKERKEKERQRTTSFGEMDKVGATKRLFRKGQI